jgi:hypothetical protein
MGWQKKPGDGGSRAYVPLAAGPRICLRLMEGADIYQLAKNCRTSVEVIRKFYAAHIKDLLGIPAVIPVFKHFSQVASDLSFSYGVR